MTKAEINILIRTRAKEARAVLQSVISDLDRMAKAGANAGGVMDAIVGAGAGLKASLGGSSAAAAALAKTLSLVHKAGVAAGRGIISTGTAADRATAKVIGLTAAGDKLTASLIRQETAAHGAAAGLRSYTAAANAAMAAAAKGAGRNAASSAPGAAAAGSSIVPVRNASREMQRWSDANARATYNTRIMGREVATMGAAAASAAPALAGGARRVFSWRDSMADATVHSQRFGNEVRALGPGVSDLDNRVGRAGRNWGAFNNSLYDSSSALRKAGSQMQWTGRQLSVMFTAPTLLATGLGVKWAMDQEKAFTRMAKVYDGAIEDIDQNTEQAGIQFSGSKFDLFFTALSEKMGQTKKEVADIGAIWAQVGAQGRNLAEATKLTTEFMVVGDQDAEKSARDLISIQAQYKISIGELTQVIHDLNAIENATAVSMKDLADGFTRTAAVAREAGVDTRHLGAFIAALVPAAGTAAVSANGLKSIFTRLMVPTKESAKQLANLGISTSDPNWINKNAVERLQILSERMQGLSQQQKFDLAKPFAGLYQINKFVALMDDLGSAQGYYQRSLRATEDPARSFAVYQKELNRVLDSSPQKFKQVGVILQNSLVKIITPLIPHILYLAQGVAKLMKSFSEMNPVMQKWIVLGFLLLAAVGPLAMLIGSFAILFGVAGKALVIFNRFIALTAFHMLGLGAATRVVEGEVVRRTPIIVRVWRAMMAAMRMATAAGIAVINGIWVAGMGALNLVLKAGAALGLKNFAWYEAMRARVQVLAARRLVATEVATQSAMTGAAAAGGRARVGVAGASGAAAGAAAGRGMRGGLLATAARVAMFFPQTIWNAIKAVPGLFARIWPTVLNAAKQFGPRLLAILARLSPRIAVIALDIAGALTGPIGWALAALITLISFFPDETWAILKGWAALWWRTFTAAVRFAQRGMRGLGNVVARGMEWVMAEIANMAARGVPLLAQPFVLGVRLAGAALAALPRIVANVFRAVVNTIANAAKAVYNAFSYINPFAHHSPSLVENVRAGMSIVKDEFSSMADSVSADTQRAYDSISRFGGAVAGLNSRAGNIELQKKRDSIRQADPKALPAYDAWNAQLPPLQRRMEQLNSQIKTQEAHIEGLNGNIKRLQSQIDSADKAIDGMNKTLDHMREVSDALSKALDKAQSQLDYYASAPIQGMRAMSDAIFENEMAQKRLQLEIMKLEDAGQSVDAVKDKFAALQGQIEELSGKREELRQAGAGSDILDTYDKMIQDLQAQQGSLATSGVSEIERAQKDLERLQREGEKLDLENSLKFDPLTRQIDQMVNATKELSFDEITRGIQSNQAAVNSLTTAYEASNAAIEAQEFAIKRAEEARDALNDQLENEQDNLDREQEKLDALQKSHDEVSTAIDAVKKAMDDLSSSADTVNSFLEEQKRKAEEAAGGMDAAAKSAAASKAAFENAGLGDFDVPGGDNFNLDKLMGGNEKFDDLTKSLTDGVSASFSKIDLTRPVKDFFARIGRAIAAVPGDVASWFVGITVAFAAWVASLSTQVGTWFYGVGKSIGSWFGGLWNNYIWPGLVALPGQIGTFFQNLPNMLVDAISYMSGFMAGLIVKTFILMFKFDMWLLGAFSKAFDWVVENAAKLTMGVINWFIGLPEQLLNALGDLGQLLMGWFTAAWNWTAQNVPLAAAATLSFFYNLPGNIVSGLSRLGEMLVGAFNTAFSWLVNDMPRQTMNVVNGLWNGLVTALGDVGKWVMDHIVNPFINGFKDALGIHSPSTVMAGFGKNIIEGLWNGIMGTGSWLKDKLTKWIDENVPGPVKKLLGINSPSKLFAGYGKNLAEGLALGIESGAGMAMAASSGLAQAAADAASSVDMAAGATGSLNPLLAPPAADELSALSAGLTAVQDAYAGSYATIVATTSALTDGMYGELNASTADYAFVTDGQFTALSDAVIATTSTMGANISALTDGTITHLTSSWDNGRTAVANATVQMADDGTRAFQTLADNMSGIMTNQVKPMLNEFDPMLKTVTGWFGETVKNIGTQWEGVKEPVAVPARFIVNDVYNKGIKEAWNQVNGFLGLPKLNDYVAQFADGGRALGAGGGRSDLIPAMLSNGEHVIPTNEVRAAGGHAAIERQRAIWRHGMAGMSPAAMFAFGGPVDTSLWGAVSTAFPGATLNSAYRPGDSGLHGQGKAIDIGGPMQQIADWIYNTYPQSAMLIWNNGPGLYYGEKDFAKVRSIYTEPVMAQHADHVHWGSENPITSDGKMVSSATGSAARITYQQQVEEIFKRVMTPIRESIPKLGDHAAAQIPPKGYDKFHDEVKQYLMKAAAEQDSKVQAAFGSNASGAGVEQWHKTIEHVLMTQGRNLGLVGLTKAQMQTESGGNANAINLTDSNAQKGTPSKGLMQVIDPTFQAYRDSRFPNDIWNPEANIAAALNYVFARYGGPEGVWGQGHGYDSGGILEPTPGGYGTYYNHTGKPEMVLTSSEWAGILNQANAVAKFSSELVEIGVKDALHLVYGDDPTRESAEAQAAAIAEANGEWTPVIYDAAKAQVAASNSTADSAKKTATGVEKFTETAKAIEVQVKNLSEVGMAALQASKNPNSFGAWAPLLNSVAKLVEGLPDAKPTYVSWAGTNQPVTEEMKRQKQFNDLVNLTKGAYQVTKTVLPPLLRHTAIIGTATEQILTQNSSAISAAIAMAPVNPVGAAIIAVPIILQAIFTLLPLILAAIIDIVPAMIKAVMKFLQQYMPDSVFAYDTYDLANQAAINNNAAIKSGASGPNFNPPVQSNQTNSNVTINVYGVNVEAKDANSADQFVTNLQNLS